MTNNNIPAWLLEDECYQPKKDSSSFIDKSANSMVHLLSGIKRNSQKTKAREANTSFRLFGLLIMLVLTSVSKNYSFVMFMMCVAVVRIALLNGDRIKSLLKVVIPAVLLSALILLPSIFLGNPTTMLLVVSKIFVCTSLVMALNLTTPFNEITRSLKAFRVPNIVIFTFDLTLKYIALLGEICAEMLKALKIRSIGKNNKKSSAASGVLGTVFIKAKRAGEDTVTAMECRGFSGNYVVVKRKFKLTAFDFIYFVLLALVIGVFVYLEVMV